MKLLAKGKDISVWWLDRGESGLCIDSYGTSPSPAIGNAYDSLVKQTYYDRYGDREMENRPVMGPRAIIRRTKDDFAEVNEFGVVSP